MGVRWRRQCWAQSDTVKPVYNDPPRDTKQVAVVEKWSLFTGGFMLYILKLGPKNSGRCLEIRAVKNHF